jgi:GT2 family glycosyltransferase
LGTWGAGNFDNDSAVDYIVRLADDLETKIDEILADEDLSALDEYGEGVLMPSIVLISLLYDHCHAPTPDLEKVQSWKQKYLAIFDDQIEGAKPEYAEKRRLTIVETFAKLETQAVEFAKIVKANEASITYAGS